MARRVISEQYYTFTPSTKTISIPRAINREKILLITDVTNNIVLYNFSDPSLPFASFSNANNVTTIVLGYNTATASFNTTDKIQILLDEDQPFKPAEEMMDPVGKMRVSTPQALIDTDFEYGLQPTKWEQLSLINYRPSYYYNPANTVTISNLQATNGSRTVTANIAGAITGVVAAGNPIYIQDATWQGASGLYVVDSIVSSGGGANAFTYTARYPFTGSTGTIFDSNNTTAFVGGTFTGNGTAIGISANTFSGTNVVFNTTFAHGLAVGNEIAVSGTSASTNPPNGSWIVTTVDTPNSFTFAVTNTPTGSITGGTVYMRPQGFALHRAYDGGVKFSTFAASHNQQFIRQTRRYFRYQSGKGIQMSTGTVIKPSILPDAISSSGTTVTVLCKEPHNVQPGNQVTIAGCVETAYNGTFTIATVKDPFTFTYTAASTPSASPASGNYTVSISSWYGAKVRVGLFDDQNGIFFEHDGQQLYAVRRSSTYQIAGYITAVNGSTQISGATTTPNGSATLFSKQLTPGDFIVIRGMSYRILTIDSDTQMQVSPPYRGVTIASPQIAVVTRTVDTRVPQSQWNIDRCDGTGASGFTLDLTRMQMFYMDYSWYGAGFIRWGFRSSDGNVVYCHKQTNNNTNYLAYMRSGNLPARYEVNTFPPITTTTATVAIADTTITVANTSGFPSNGTIIVKNSTAQEAINYTATTNTTFTGLTRAQSGGALTFTTTSGSVVITGTSTSGVQVGMYVVGTGIPTGTQVVSFVNNSSVTLNQAATASGSITATFYPLAKGAAQTFTFSATSPTAVELYSPTFSPTISHWGTSVIMDGRYDDDKSFVFTRSMPTALTVSSGAVIALMSLRLAPSVSGGTGQSLLGQRELVNRMQVVLRQLDLSTTGNFLVSLVLNGQTSDSTAWTSQGGSSLAQYVFHASGATLVANTGESIFGFFTNNSGSTASTATSQDLNSVRDLGASIYSGGYSTACNTAIYPDGPDRVTVVAQNISATSSTIFARLAWTEAQA